MKVTIYHEDCIYPDNRELCKMNRNEPWDPEEGGEAYSCPTCGLVVNLTVIPEDK